MEHIHCHKIAAILGIINSFRFRYYCQFKSSSTRYLVDVQRKAPCFPHLCKWNAFTIDTPRSALRPLHLAARENFFPWPLADLTTSWVDVP